MIEIIAESGIVTSTITCFVTPITRACAPGTVLYNLHNPHSRETTSERG